MKKFFSFLTISVFAFAFFLFSDTGKAFAASGTIDPEGQGYQYAEVSLDGSTINFKCQNCNVSVSDDSITGYAWSENFGWINLSPTSAGVVNDGSGVLSGYAFGENIGWINFNPTLGGVEIVSDGFFKGNAWSENVGWIDFGNGGCPNGVCVYTDWKPGSGGGGFFGGGGNAPPMCSDGIDNDNDGFVDYPEDLGCQDAGGGSEVLTACGSLNADNFNLQTNIHNESLCIYSPVEGCMDPQAINFNPIAEIENDSCLYAGCTNSSALNYNSNADFNDGSCVFGEIPPPPPGATPGCTDSLALNFNPSADFENGSCEYLPLPVFGCTSSGAENFNPSATNDNGSCIFVPVTVGEPTNTNTGKGFGLGRLPFMNPGVLFILSTLGLLFGGGGTLISLLASPLRFLNSIPAILGMRRKKRPWGVVFDSVTKQPLDPVYVELKTVDGKSVTSSITDLDGRFGFLASRGIYLISAGKKDYLFPSKKLAGKTSDTIYENLYFGEEVEQKEDDGIVAKNIPLDPLNFNWNEYEKSRNKKLMKFFSKTDIFLSKIANTAFVLGFAFSFIAVYLYPVFINFLIIAFYLFIFILSLFGVKPRRPGFVTEKGTGLPLAFGIIRIFSADLNREISRAVIGKTGRYFSLVANGEYYMTVEKKVGDESYKKVYTSPAFSVTKGQVNKVVKV